MKKFFSKIQDKIDGSKPSYDAEIPPTNKPLSGRQYYQFRKQRGVNLGAWFSLEAWLTPSLFEKAKDPKDSEHDLVSALSTDEARALLENHWDNFINDGDWQWMASHGINSVRLPVGYFHVLAGFQEEKVRALLSGTDFEKYADVYQGAWPRIQNAIETARKHNIGVLLDLHSAPGCQNADGHSGMSTGKVKMWEGFHSGKNQRKTTEILVALASALGEHENVIGLELLNEPQNHSDLHPWYEKTIHEIRTSASPAGRTLPLYIGDGWATDHYADLVGKKSAADNFLVLDHHYYRAFTNEDHNTAAEAHAQAIDPDANGHCAGNLANQASKCNGSIIIGEWSGALNPNSFQKSQIQSKLQARTMFSQAEWKAFERITAGYYYWTLKKEGGPDPGWCLYTAIEKGSMPPSLDPLQSRRPNPDALAGQLDNALGPRLQGHVDHWSKQGGEHEHWRFEEGFRLAWSDAGEFARQGTEVGLAGQLTMLRGAAHRQEKGDSPVAWEFDHGYSQGLEAYKQMMYS
ncbi:hypothetical protein MCUN1_000062 [Malassezia cuniculi]|uniref:Glycoside hydrolase family 5 domain-containing protein n=1 Tax=Malassezia cuniculi TaxID=948313 RepID=A0AAF0EQY4_9BASI|nr:hypothetical protein MCUN1_000062 [Malassezia cuniculi]